MCSVALAFSMRAAVSLNIRRRLASTCMIILSLSIISLTTRHSFVSAVAAARRWTPVSFVGIHHQTTSSSTINTHLMMSTSSSSDQNNAGLSDIGKSSSNNANSNNNGDDSTRIRNWKERIDISIAKSRKIRGSNFVQISTINYETMEPRCRTVVFRGFLKDVPFSAVQDVLGSSDSDSSSSSGDNDDKIQASYGDCVMKMITDNRSNKVQELAMFHNSNDSNEMTTKKKKNGNTAEMVWWFPKSNEQYRVRGRLQFIGGNGTLHSYCNKDAKEEEEEEDTNYFLAERKQQWGNLSDMAREQFYWSNPGIDFISEMEQAKGVPAGGRDNEGKILPVPDTFLLMLLYPTSVNYLKLGDNYSQVSQWESNECQWKSVRVNP